MDAPPDNTTLIVNKTIDDINVTPRDILEKSVAAVQNEACEGQDFREAEALSPVFSMTELPESKVHAVANGTRLERDGLKSK